MVLIFPPVAKACEPPAGVTRLAATLHTYGVPCRILDANLEGQLYLLKRPEMGSDTWTHRSLKNLSSNLVALHNMQTYASPARYSRAVRDVNRVLSMSACGNASVTLGDYQHSLLSPLRSSDLLFAAEHPEENPFYPYFEARLTEMIDQSHTPLDTGGHHIFKSHNVVGFSLNFLSQALTTFAMIGFVKKRFPWSKIAVGGGLVSSWMKRPKWDNPFKGLIDHFIAGPGEGELLALAGIKISSSRPAIPDYTLLALSDYLSPGLILPYSCSSGCYWNQCSFCPERAEGNAYIPVPVKRSLANLHELVMKTRPALVHLLDNAVSPAIMQGLIDDPLEVSWYGFARFSDELAELDYCLKLKRSGCTMLKLGLESGDQGVLDKLQKGIDVSKSSQILMNLRKAGIKVYLYLLFGTPVETKVEARKTLEFVVRHRETINFLNLAIFNMPVGGNEMGEYETEPFYEGDLSLYTGFRHPLGWDRKKVRQFISQEFIKEPAIADILKKDPPIFTSNHAALFTTM